MPAAHVTLSRPQLDLIRQPAAGRLFLEGPAGTGKTTAAVERLLGMLEAGVPGDSILLLLPQRSLAEPYLRALQTPGLAPGGVVSLLTIGGLAQRMVELFWALAGEAAGFARPDSPPVFLTLETAQYYMAHLVRPLLEQGYFESVVIDRNRLYSQILDNLNKAAAVGFDHAGIGERLKGAWVGDPGQLRIYDDAQHCASLFRQFCLQHNLLDFSLQVEIFNKHLWPLPACRELLRRTYRHLLADNLEENPPAAFDVLRDWLPHLDSALLVYDQQAGYRRFLGADPDSAYLLRGLCERVYAFDESFVTPPALNALGLRLGRALGRAASPESEAQAGQPIQAGLEFERHTYYPQMLDWVAGQVAGLVHEQGAPPGEIVILAPFLSDSLRFALSNRLEALSVPVRSHRPSRSLREEPVTQCLLTLACLAHPEWGLAPSRFDFAYALLEAIEGMDLVRAQLLAEIVYRVREGAASLSPFERIEAPLQERITYLFGERYERLRAWIEQYRAGEAQAFDHFLALIFGELLSQPGFGFHHSFAAGEVTANLIESVRKFRQAVGETLDALQAPLGREYLHMVQDGVIAAQYIRSWQAPLEDAVLIAPAYTFLMQNRPVDFQFWLDAGSRSWFERIEQPLTHPYVLSRAWTSGAAWTDFDEEESNQESLYRLALGLLRRCRVGVRLGLSQWNEQGYESRGPLLRAIDRALRYAPPPAGAPGG
jgi:hypothetical protein